jgi:FAD/FMN-containing dehydrogenase/Fe-S oxidoreductase
MAFDTLARAPYCYDAGLYECDPLGVVAPRSEHELAAVIRYASDQNLPVHPRGAGTGRSGGCLGSGLVVDLSRHFRHLQLQADRVVAQAGVVLDTINHALAPYGRRIAVDPDHPESSTLGGLISRDAYGTRSHRAGSMADQLVSVRGLLANGEPIHLVPSPVATDDEDALDPLSRLTRRLSVVVNWSGGPGAGEIQRLSPEGCPRLDAVTDSQRFDLPRLVAGSLGTLMIVTEATLKTEPLPSCTAVVLLPFARLVDAAEAVMPVLGANPACCELFDGRLVTLARDSSPLLRQAIPEPCQGLLLIGFEGRDAARVADAARRLADRFSERPNLVSEPVDITRRTDAEELMRLRRGVDTALARTQGALRPVEPLASIRIPPATLPSFVLRLQNLMRLLGVSGTIDAHAGLARVRFRPFLDLACLDGRELVDRLAGDVLELALSLGGTAAIGRRPDRGVRLKRILGDRLNYLREIKYAFDPKNLLNPDVLAAGEAPSTASRLRAIPSRAAVDRLVQTSQTGSMVLRWTGAPRSEHLAACDNCGVCRSTEPRLRMCPVFRATRAEDASPRSKINLLRQVAAGVLDPRQWGSDEFRGHSELCVHCKLCESECPSGVDVSGLMLEAKAAYVAIHGLTPEDWMLSRIDQWAQWATRSPRLFNVLMANRPVRWVLQRAFGLSQYRHLPQAQAGSFLKRAERLGLTRARPHEPGPRAALFLDLFTNHFDQELADCLVAVLRHLGVNVFVPRSQKGCGMPALVSGDIDRARDLLQANLKVLGNAIRDGYTIITAEPTALLILKRESLRLSDDLDAALVAENAMDAGQYLRGLLALGNSPRPETPVQARVGYHQPCHLRALNVGTPGLDLIRAIPQLDVEFLDRGCSGMAGIYGLSSRNFRDSLRAGRALLRRLRDPDFLIGSTECSACRMQMEQGASKRVLHPYKLLALGYGLAPDLRRHLTNPKPRRQLA